MTLDMDQDHGASGQNHAVLAGCSIKLVSRLPTAHGLANMDFWGGIGGAAMDIPDEEFLLFCSISLQVAADFLQNNEPVAGVGCSEVQPSSDPRLPPATWGYPKISSTTGFKWCENGCE